MSYFIYLPTSDVFTLEFMIEGKTNVPILYFEYIVITWQYQVVIQQFLHDLSIVMNTEVFNLF